MKEVVVLGGGSGMSSILRGMKNIPNINISAIVTVADDGGSTALMRREFNIPAVGDLRQILIALSSTEDILKDLMEYRFHNKNIKKSVFHNQSLGNIIISSLININNDFYKGIETLSKVLKIKGSIYPLTDYPKVRLQAVYTDGTKIIGEHKIPNGNKIIDSIRYLNTKKIKTNPDVLKQIKKADYIVISTGSLYTSIIPNLIAPGVREAILDNKKVKLIYIGNVMTQYGETQNMSLYEHVIAIEKHLNMNENTLNNKIQIQVIIANNRQINSKILGYYEKENSFPVYLDENNPYFRGKLWLVDLIDDSSTTNLVRHDFKKIENVLTKVFTTV
ncbi:gluconeogenesis factor YvcK family protein [Mycoplasmoides alvi]|uniref:gluconeogenesis factor YvcK family protein n=1 Tax=Mycoplasmoides alvi TaxID=78580 RepID=UPI00051B560C|nr:gluconeogenesis factor YvcK family protein [Mycoplasmoides alvi]